MRDDDLTILLTILRGGGGSDPYSMTPTQSLGAELLTNPSMDWAAGALTGWTLTGTTVGGDPGISEVASGGGAGTGAVRMVSSATANRPSIKQAVLTSGNYYEIYTLMSAYTSGAIDVVGDTFGAAILAPSTAYSIRRIIRANTTDFDIRGRGAAPHDLVIAEASVKALTANGQQTAPSADGTISFLYTLPGTPLRDDSVWLMARISDFSAGNYWLAQLIYTGSQWNISLNSVASHTRTSRTSASNIGTTNGVRIVTSGDTLQLFTTANGGTNWTQRGTDVTNSLYNTATGYNVIYGSQFTPGVLRGSDFLT